MVDIMPTWKFGELETDTERKEAYMKLHAAYAIQKDILNTMVMLAKAYPSSTI